MAVTGVAMLLTGVVSSPIGPKPTLVLGLAVVVAAGLFRGVSNTLVTEPPCGRGRGRALVLTAAAD